MSAVPKPYVGLETYFELERSAEVRSEYFRGELFAMAGGSPAHSRILVNLNRILDTQLLDRPCTVYSSETRVQAGDSGLYTYPDVSVVCGEAQFDTHDNLQNPTVLIEVLSPTTEAYDRGRKFDMYRTLSSMRQYVLVSQEEMKVYVFTRQSDQEWLMAVATGPQDTAMLASIRCELPLAEVYRKVPFKPAPPPSRESP